MEIKSNYRFFILFLILFTFTINFLLIINHEKDPYYDDYYYFPTIIKFDKAGGVSHFWQNYLGKKVTSSLNEPALYYFLLLPFASDSSEFFLVIKYINYLIVIALIITIYFVGKNLFNPSVGLFAAFLISIHPIILRRVVFVTSESLLILFSMLSLYFFIQGFKKNYHWLFGFLFSLLAFLSKSNGVFLPLAFIVTLFYFLIFKSEYLKSKTLPTLIIISSILTYILFFDVLNTMFYNIVVKELLRVNFNLDISEDHLKGSVQYYPGFIEMIQTDLIGFLKKLLWGITFDAHRFGIGLFVSIVFYKIPGIIHLNSGLILIPLFIYLILKEENIYKRILFFTFVLIAFLINIPKASANHNAARYTIMVTPLFFYLIAPYFIRLIEMLGKKMNLNKKFIVIPFLLILLGFGIHYKNSIKDFTLIPHFSEDYQQSLDWLKEHCKEEVVVAVESNSKLQFKWYIPNITEENISSTKNGKELSPDEYRNLFKELKAQYIVVDTNAKSAYNETPKYFFYNYLKKHSPETVMEHLGLDFELAFKSSGEKAIYIYRYRF